MPPRPPAHLSRYFRTLTIVLAWWLSATLSRASAADTEQSLEAEFQSTMIPWIKQYCGECHGGESPEAQLDLLQFTTLDAVRIRHGTWSELRRHVDAREMPPENANQPPDGERNAVLAWIERFRRLEIERTADDPGPNLARRLNSAEYNHTIRDLTGFDLRPAREFPVDPANEAGFDNSGQSLTMSPALLEKYLAAAQQVADHLVFTPTELRFAPHPVVTDSDRDKYCVGRIIEFYRRHEVNLAEYLVATRDVASQISSIPLDDATTRVAAARALSAKYLRLLYEFLASESPAEGVTAEARQRWRTLISNELTEVEFLRSCRDLAELLRQRRAHLSRDIEAPQAQGISSGSQAFLLWKNRQEAAQRQTWQGEAATELDAASDREFCAVIPNEFFVTERGMNKGRPLSAGFHLMVGYFRDDAPLYELVLNDAEQQEIDTLWSELDFITLAPIRQYKDYIFFERAEPPRFMFDAQFDFARSEDHDVTSETKMNRLAELYLAKAEQAGASDLALTAIREYYERMSATIRSIEQAHAAAEPQHLHSLIALAPRVYRRPLTEAEPNELRDFYRRTRDAYQLTHEDAIRLTFVSMLASPYFCYHYHLAADATATPSHLAVPVSHATLANRLSYFLWSSMPDAKLMELAAANQLSDPKILLAQVDRMCEDDRCFGFTAEFCGNWLDFRRFEEHNSVDRQRFPEFDDTLREAMFAEPLIFFQDLLQRDGSVLDLLYGPHTFVNESLAKHYGIDIGALDGEPLDLALSSFALTDAPWYRIPNATEFGRGGLLPMAVFLTKNSPGLRTSPVKRGYWVVRRLLGQSIPPPPPNVPELPKDESDTGDHSLPELLAKHRDNPNCAACHERFDSLGLAFEGFGPVGERRTIDLGGRAVENVPIYPDHRTRAGVDGLQEYVRQEREDEFVDNLCRKMFAYAIGRELLLSDEKSLERAKSELQANDHRIRSLLRAIVTSPQFLNHRTSHGPPNPNLPASR